ncbi:MAG: hypothetical protein MZV64_62675 [Ignavibacteriales bacterium]|nr:hypothetical protein [Ignavibacteriales bacterium]
MDVHVQRQGRVRGSDRQDHRCGYTLVQPRRQTGHDQGRRRDPCHQVTIFRYCEEQDDEAIPKQGRLLRAKCTLAMTGDKMNFFGKRVLFLGAHPDDIEIGMRRLDCITSSNRPTSCASHSPTTRKTPT